MDFLPKNKWLALLVFMIVIVVSVLVALSLLQLKPNPKIQGSYDFAFGGKQKAVTPKV